MASPAGQRVQAIARVQRIVSSEPLDGIVAAEALDGLGIAIAAQRVATRRGAMDHLDRVGSERVARGIQGLIEKRIAPMIAARLLELSPWQVRNLRTRFSESGPSGLVSRRRGKPSNRSYHQQFRQKVLQLVTTHYGDFGPTFACQKLRERHGCTVSVGTLKTWMKQDGLWQERRARQKAVHQPDGTTNVSVNWS